MSNLSIKTLLVIFQVLLVVVQAFTFTYVLRARKLNKGRWRDDKNYVSEEKLSRLTTFIHVITAVVLFISTVVLVL